MFYLPRGVPKVYHITKGDTLLFKLVKNIKKKVKNYNFLKTITNIKNLKI